jgi:hypothetical protein
MTRSFALPIAAGLALALAPAGRANEIFPVVHNEPITVQVLSGKDGKPVPNAHILVLAGYTPEDLRMRLWHDESLTDAEGKAVLSKAVGNLPYVQVWVGHAPLCQGSPNKAAFSVDLVRRDGLSAPNRCGVATVSDQAGVFTVFVKPSKQLLSPARKDVLALAAAYPVATHGAANQPAAIPAPIEAPKPAPAAVVATPKVDVSTLPQPSCVAEKDQPAIPVPVTMEPAGQIHDAAAEAAQAKARAAAALARRASRRRALERAKATAAAQPAAATPAAPAAKTASPAKGAKAPASTAKQMPLPPVKVKTTIGDPANAKVVRPTAPKIAVDLKTAPAAARPATLDTSPHPKPSAGGRDLEERGTRRIKNPKDAAAAKSTTAAPGATKNDAKKQ